ncbi:MAG: hypothetical protein AW07_03731 [Candidatus Accumulibacter sp. SK-11]|nr:MAG: hypothetical protein AW07_03731 [Candidatus Accumulibacter sp. SK-11]
MIEQRVQEAFGLAAAGAGGDQRPGGTKLTGQSLPCRFLMDVSGMLRLETPEKRRAPGAGPERQADLDIGAFQPGCLVVGEALHDAGEEGVRWFETGRQEVLQTVVNLAREQGGQHRGDYLRLAESVISRWSINVSSRSS